MRAVIFANGDMPHRQQDLARLSPEDTIIAADGGFHHCLSLGLMPAYLIGDLDSIESDERARLESSKVTIDEYPVDKDQTDLALAVQKAIELGAHEVLMLGAIGSRWDHSMANVLLTGAEQFREVSIVIASGPQDARLLRSGGTTTIEGAVGDRISFVPISDEVEVSSSEGLAFPIKNQFIQLGSTLMLSNQLIDETAKLTIVRGQMICFKMQKGFKE